MIRSFAARALVVVLVLAASCAKHKETPTAEAPAKSLSEGEARRFGQLTIRLIMQGPGLVGTPPTSPCFSADGSSVFFQWNPPARLDSMSASDPENAYDHYLDLEREAGTFRLDVATHTLKKLADAVADTTVPDEFAWDKARRRRAEIRNGDLWLVDLGGARTRRVTQTAEEERTPQISADGGTVYFVRGANAYAIPFGGGIIRQLTQIETSNAPDEPRPGPQRKFLIDQQKALFVEFRDRGEKEKKEKNVAHPRKLYVGSGFTVQRVLVSPSGSYVALALTREPPDARKPVIPLVVTESGYTETEEVRTMVGDAQEESRIVFVDVAADSLVWMKSDATTTVEAKAWSPTEDVLLVRELPGNWHERRFSLVSPRQRDADGKTVPRLLDRFHDDAWVDGPDFDDTGAWLPDGSGVYFISEAGGWGHLHSVSVTGRHQQLTRGAFEVYDAILDEANARWFLLSNEGRPGSRRLWTMDLDGGNRRLLTANPGSYDLVPAPSMALAAVTYSSATHPPELYLFDASTGTLDGPYTESTTKAFRAYSWLEPETVAFKASDGVNVPAHLFRPERFGGTPNGAGVIFIHGAGYLQNVIDGWSYYYREFMFNSFLAARGYTVLNVDYRGSAGYGRDCRTAIYKHMGGRDLDDVIDGARYLVREHGVGEKQVGVYGGSYGGFLTLMALFKYPDEIAAGAALRSVTDWAHYNHGYTVRILGTPAEDPEAYRRSSPIYFAEGLAGNLVMLHGLRDDNVLAEDVLRLSQRLIELGKENWDLTLYPVERHAYRRASSWTDQMTRAYKVFERTLPARAPAP
jgi:dipeptidyl aminopeptidase/acylaminoacyl peptidase